jgi:hypothetical protein
MTGSAKGSAGWGKYDFFGLAAGAVWLGVSDWLTSILWTGDDRVIRFAIRSLLFVPVLIGIVVSIRRLKKDRGQ